MKKRLVSVIGVYVCCEIWSSAAPTHGKTANYTISPSSGMEILDLYIERQTWNTNLRNQTLWSLALIEGNESMAILF